MARLRNISIHADRVGTSIVYLLCGRPYIQTAMAPVRSPLEAHSRLRKALRRVRTRVGGMRHLLGDLVLTHITALTPFHSDSSGNFWTTNTVVNTTVFGYTYPEFLNGSSSADIMGYVNELYGPDATATAGSIMKRRDIAEELSENFNCCAIGSNSGGFGGGFRARSIQYIANVAYPRWTLDGSYTIYLFLGKPPQEDGLLYQFAENLIGSVNVLSVPGMTSNKQIATGAIPLTRALNAQIGGRLLQSLSRIFVIPFLQRALVWRVAAASGQIVPNDQVPGLEVSVVSADFTPPSSPNTFPIYSPFAALADITDGKAGGLKFGVNPVCETT